jgi:glycine dehydrogenase subunit 2
MNFRQAKWKEPVIFELSKKGKKGFDAPKLSKEELTVLEEVKNSLPEKVRRKKLPNLPEVSEVEVVRHYTRLSQMNYGVDLGIYPLGSCTMKYNPKVCEVVAKSPKITYLHPYEDEEICQGVLEIMYKLEAYLSEITGMDRFTLQPAAGAQGEFTGALIIRAYHKDNKELNQRDEIIIPDSSHGTNPASAAMAGFKVVVVPSNDEGLVDIEALKSLTSKRTAGMMITNPNTLGLFEKDVDEISKIVHEVGGLMYYDGANLNAIMGICRPGDMGMDIMHVNLHKTFATPHGGGGPGSGPVGVKKFLADYLPIPTVEFNGKKYYLDYNKPKSIGKVKGFYGNINQVIRAYTYIVSLGGKGLRLASELAVLNANYVMKRILEEGEGGYSLPRSKDRPRMHEGVLSAKPLMEETGVRALEVSKALLDHGVHAPTMYFPLIVDEALMIEPTETESLEELDRFIDVMIKIRKVAKENANMLKSSPKNTSVTRVDELKASHPKTMMLRWKKVE